MNISRQYNYDKFEFHRSEDFVCFLMSEVCWDFHHCLVSPLYHQNDCKRDMILTVHRRLICGNKMPTRCNRDFYCRSYCLLYMFRAPLCPSSGAQEYCTVVAACGVSCCGFQVVGLVWSWGLCVWFAQLHTRPATWKPQHETPQAATTA